MLIFDYRKIGNNLLRLRKKAGMTQAELAETAGMSDRTYADIERGNVNMRVETLLRICRALGVSPNDVLTEDSASDSEAETKMWEILQNCSKKEKKTAVKLLEVYLSSVQ